MKYKDNNNNGFIKNTVGILATLLALAGTVDANIDEFDNKSNARVPGNDPIKKSQRIKDTTEVTPPPFYRDGEVEPFYKDGSKMPSALQFVPSQPSAKPVPFYKDHPPVLK